MPSAFVTLFPHISRTTHALPLHFYCRSRTIVRLLPPLLRLRPVKSAVLCSHKEVS